MIFGAKYFQFDFCLFWFAINYIRRNCTVVQRDVFLPRMDRNLLNIWCQRTTVVKKNNKDNSLIPHDSREKSFHFASDAPDKIPPMFITLCQVHHINQFWGAHICFWIHSTGNTRARVCLEQSWKRVGWGWEKSLRGLRKENRGAWREEGGVQKGAAAALLCRHAKHEDLSDQCV